METAAERSAGCDEDAAQRLMEMGFPLERSRRTLVQTGGDLDAAMELMLALDDDPAPPRPVECPPGPGPRREGSAERVVPRCWQGVPLALPLLGPGPSEPRLPRLQVLCVLVLLGVHREISPEDRLAVQQPLCPLVAHEPKLFLPLVAVPGSCAGLAGFKQLADVLRMGMAARPKQGLRALTGLLRGVEAEPLSEPQLEDLDEVMRWMAGTDRFKKEMEKPLLPTNLRNLCRQIRKALAQRLQARYQQRASRNRTKGPKIFDDLLFNYD